MLDDLGSVDVRFYAVELGLLNRIRAWASKNCATVTSSRYATNAFEGVVRVRWQNVTARNATRPETRAEAVRKLIRDACPYALK